ncbi:MAG: beta/gamma crystallin-related protein [Pseudomonadota bacterium]
MPLPGIPSRKAFGRRFAVLALAAAVLVSGPAVLRAAADGDKSSQHYSQSDRAYSSRHGDYGRHAGPELVIYGDRRFSGPSAVIDGPADLRGSRFNDRVSSIEVLSGRWEVCTDPGFRGRCEIIDYDAAQLTRIGLNDKITSLRPIGRRYAGGQTDRFRTPRHDADLFGGRHDAGYGHRGANFSGAPVVLFTDPDGRGRAVPIYGPERHLNPLRMNDVVSSIDVRTGAWLVCSDPDFRGRCEVVSGFAPRTRSFGLNDNISSIRPVDYDRGRRKRY